VVLVQRPKSNIGHLISDIRYPPFPHPADSPSHRDSDGKRGEPAGAHTEIHYNPGYSEANCLSIIILPLNTYGVNFSGCCAVVKYSQFAISAIC